jgi:LAS superfamily LD-carboxypeptidase LdcB
MKNKLVLVFLVVSLIINVGLIIYVFQTHKSLTNQEIKEKFNCNRPTTDVQRTDIFCSNPDLYRQAVD